ncbi:MULTISPECIES: CU044_2847 family protein [Leptolyngbya]|uniref:CU044_2847 family protein n=1 Tax=Leptolyngbya TaxID=47251 RepID=UPI0016871A28|nr:CU044_2847 family protein [Leptolyngbya sp. FACHB-1624]MBD1858013.1 hypothetical protein [Leptolyngbya sp. FACHB-1624]
MADTQKLILKADDQEYDLYVVTTETTQEPEDEPGYRDLPTIDLQKVHTTIRGYAKYAIDAFHNFESAEVSKVTLKFNLKVGGKTGIPMLTEGSAESNFEIQIECNFTKQLTQEC